MIALWLAAALATPPAAPGDADRTAIQQAIAQRHGPSARVERAIVHGNFALADGTAATGPIRDGLHMARGRWHVACSFGSASPTPAQLRSACGFPTAIAVEISANEAAQGAAERGDFSTAVIAQTRAFESAKGPDRDQERARVQLLHQLNEQMRTGMITRAQAIQQWNAFRYSWMLPQP